MFGVGRLGSYISRGVYRVSTPFPLGGAVDIIVVEQQDGSFKSTPWYVRFGKFQGTLNESLVTFNVNGIDADFHMYLDHKGEAFFVREVDGTEPESESYLSSGDDMVDVKADSWRKHKSKSCNIEAGKEVDGSPRKSLSRSSSRRGRIFGLPIGRRSMKGNGYQDTEAERVNSLERAEIAADLLEVRWSTNLQTGIVVDSSKGQCNEESDSQFVSSKVNAMEFTLEETYMAIHSNSTENGSTKPSQRVVNERIEGRAVPCNDRNDSQDGVGTLPQRSRGEGFVGEIVGTKEVEEAPLSGTSTAELCNSAIGSVNVLSSEELSAAISNLKSLSSVLEKENSVGNAGESTVISNATDSCHDSIDRSTASDDSKEEQFVFSDLNEPKLGKGQRSKSSSFGSAEWLSPSGSSDDGESNSVMLGESNQVTSRPIGISKIHSDAEVAALVPVVESLPNMVRDGDDLSLNATQPFGRSLDSTLEAFKMVDDDIAIDKAQQQMVHLHSNKSQISEEIRKIISDPAIDVSLCRHLLFEGMGYEGAARAFDTEKLDMDKFLSLGRDILENDKLVVRIGGLYFPWDAALPIASAIGSQGHVQNLEPKGMIAVGEVDDGTSEGVAPDSINSRSGSWRMWPFSSKRTNSIRNRNSSSGIITRQTEEIVGAIDTVKPSVLKKKLRAKFPTSEQLRSLNLQEGKNSVTFTFSTAMFGEQQVDARIFLWKWNSRIVISDVDGTITKSDVLGQFMPLMGYDWSQTGVTHLFSAIKENGYQLLFLSARSISQAYLTRQFLINLKQDGKALPEGPVLISPDGLFPSLYREVIRRAPHEFKIACLEDVKVLFPEDHSPFYAGFGNRDTDELSYLKVGIPRGKIFTINPRGEVVVNRRVDTKSYTSLQALVHDMFPPTTMHEQEDYNSWNFWRLPPPDAII